MFVCVCIKREKQVCVSVREREKREREIVFLIAHAYFVLTRRWRKNTNTHVQDLQCTVVYYAGGRAVLLKF